jgi:ketohexokinase
MARVLAVGVAALDIVNEVASYPPEDGEIRVLAQDLRRGGNATNTLVVLAQLGHRCDWAGVSAQAPGAEIVFDDLQRAGVGIRYSRQLVGGKIPTSYITVSRSTASRTILHYRDLPEYDFEAFTLIPLQEFDWVHFEGRNVAETLRMMRWLRKQVPLLPVSLEVEKPRQDIESLLPHANLILFSAAVPAHHGLSAQDFLTEAGRIAVNADIVCTLGEEGAIARTRRGEALCSEAFRPHALVDTLAAGDTFNAGMIDACLRGVPMGEALRFACQLAGNKCGQAGLHGLHIPERCA